MNDITPHTSSITINGHTATLTIHLIDGDASGSSNGIICKDGHILRSWNGSNTPMEDAFRSLQRELRRFLKETEKEQSNGESA